MAFRRPNYNQQRGDRERIKERKKQERLERREADAEKRRAERGSLLGPDAGRDAPSQQTDAREASAPDASTENE
jgi:hypothetical protein